MSYYTKYRCIWRDSVNDLECKVLIQGLTDGPITDIDGASSPFQIIYPDLKDRFQTVRGSGCQLNLISNSNMELMDLFAPGDKAYRILFYYHDELKWFGYLESEQYSEPYCESENYTVTLYGNNGFSLLEKIPFAMGDGSRYEGIITQWEVLQIILEKWGLEDYLNQIRIAIGATATGVFINSNETILHKTFINLANYYDEDGEPMTCRDVLDAILAPYGAYIALLGTNILIADIHSTASSATLQFKTFSWNLLTGEWGYVGVGSDYPINDIYSLGIHETGGDMEMVSAYNKHFLRYSKYKDDKVASDIPNEDKLIPSFNDTDWIHDTGGDDDFWKLNILTGHKDWTFDAAHKGRPYGVKKLENDEPEYFIALSNPSYGSYGPTDDILASSEFKRPYFVGNSKFYLQIRGNIKGSTRTDPYNKNTGNSCGANIMGIGVNISIGDKSFSPTYKEWRLTSSLNNMEKVIFIGGGDKSLDAQDSWQEFRNVFGDNTFYTVFPNTKEEGLLIGLDDSLSGTLKISFTGFIQGFRYSGNDTYSTNTRDTEAIRDIDIKDLEIDVLRKGDLDPDDEDPEYSGAISAVWTNEKNDSTIVHGNSSIETPVDRGGLMYQSGTGYKYIQTWKRNGITEPIEVLLLTSIMSNNGVPGKKLTVNLNCWDIFPALRIKDTNHLDGKTFMFAGGTLNPTECSMEGTYMEIKQDNFNTITGWKI